MKPLELCVLGPLELTVAGAAVPLGGRKQRLLLAVLACHANKVVSTGWLLQQLWGQEPPPSARKNLQTYVHQLRRMLGDPGRVARRPPGYSLVVGEGELDVDRFRALVEQARAAMAAGLPGEGRGQLERALALWRGPAFADLDDASTVLPETAALEEERLAATELRVEAELACGRHAELVPELSSLVASQPLRERLRAQLMLALYRSGRQAEALAVYRQARQVLVEELGLEPGEDLRELERAILAGDRALDPPARAAAATAATVAPAQLPADVAEFTGRAGGLQRLDALLPAERRPHRTAVPISAITGTAGVGKTALAVHWAHRASGRFPDGQLYVDLHGYAATSPSRPIQALAGLLRALGVAADRVPVEVEEAAALYRSLLARKRVLVVLDNASSAEQVRPLLPGSPGCAVVVTSRDRLAGLVAREGARRLALDVLAPEESLTLLARVLEDGRVEAEPPAAAELTRVCGFLPLALRIAAANLACQPDQTLAGYVAELRAGDRLERLAVDGDPQAAVRVAFDCSYTALAADARLVFRLLGLAPGPDFSVPAVAALTAVPVELARRTVDQLVGAHLVERRGAGRFGFHDLLRLYARQRAESEDPERERHAAVGRLLAWYLHAADAAARRLYPRPLRLPVAATDPGDAAVHLDDDAGALRWLDEERANLVAAVKHAAAHGPRPLAWLLADTLHSYFWRRRYTLEWFAVAHAALDAVAGAGDLRAQAAARRSLGGVNLSIGRYPRAIEQFTCALALARRSGWRDGQAATLGNLGSVYWEQGRLQRAAEHYTEALILYQQLDSPRGQANALSALGDVHRELGRLQQAADQQALALELYRRIGSLSEEANALDSLGEVELDLGLLERAGQHLASALALHRQTGSRYGEAYTLNVLAAMQRDLGDDSQALESAHASLSLASDIGDRRTQAEALNTLGSIHRDRGRLQQALDHHQRAVDLARDSGIRYVQTSALIGLAVAHQRKHQHGQAIDHALQGLAQARRAGYRVLEGHAHTALAAAHLARGSYDQAARQGRRALAIQARTGHRLGRARSLVVLGQALRHAGDAQAAAACLQEAITLFAGISAPESDQAQALLHA
jgi:DNA-binding SARP family transcriptional activator/tetratricopeptide (TPR) repeat protein